MANQNKKTSLYVLAESAIMVALATVLSMVKVYEAPYGGSVTLLSMAPIIILSMRRGVKTGLLAGFVHSVIQLLLGLNNVAWVPTPMGIVLCCLLDYILPFTLLGLAGAIAKPFKNRLVGVAVGTAIAGFLRFMCSFLSGVLIWGNLSDGLPAWTYSLTYNGSYMLPETIMTTIAAVLIYKAAPQLFRAQND